MAAIEGNNRILYIKQSGEFVPIACLTANSINENTEMFSTTTRASEGWNTYLPDNQSYNISFAGINQQSGISLETLQILKRNRIRITWGIGVLGDIAEEGLGYIVELNCDDEVNLKSKFSATIQGYGKPIQNLSAIGVNLEDFLNDGNGNLIGD